MDCDHAGPRLNQCLAATRAMDELVKTRPCFVTCWHRAVACIILFVIAGPIMTGLVLVGIIMIVSGLAGQGRIWARPVSFAGAAIMFWLLVNPPAIFNASDGGDCYR